MPAPSANDTGPGVHRLNSPSRDELINNLLGCLNVRRWARDIADRRPFAETAEVYGAADSAAPYLSTTEIESALAAHPRIGERSTSSFSRGEQSGVDTEDTDLTLALRSGNAAYERRFGHVYLVCASGRSGNELLEILHTRLSNDADTELRVVVEELRKIALLRLTKVIEG